MADKVTLVWQGQCYGEFYQRPRRSGPPGRSTTAARPARKAQEAVEDKVTKQKVFVRIETQGPASREKVLSELSKICESKSDDFSERYRRLYAVEPWLSDVKTSE